MTLSRHALLMTLAMTLVAPAVADDRAPRSQPARKGPLQSGKAAGITKAQTVRSGIALVAAGGVIAVVALAAGTSSGNGGKVETNSAPVASGTP